MLRNSGWTNQDPAALGAGIMSLKSRILLSAALLASTAPAAGADFDAPVVYDPPVVVQEIEEYVPVEVGSGWYLRGDIGYSFATTPSGAFTYRTFAAGIYTDNTYTTGAYANEISFGAGFGYRFTDLIRADLTAENFNVRFNGTRDNCVIVGVGCTDTAEMSAWSVMLNGYVDLGTFAGFTPYVGAGAGVTYANWGTATTTTPTFPGVSFTHPGMPNWRFSYAAMAGVAYDVNKNLKIDLGYKYRRVAGGDMFGFDAANAAAGATGAEARDPGFSQHEIRLGLRYELW
jgi:opacity protein-like surface antigen